MLDSYSIVLEKCNFVHEKSLKSPWISFLKKCGNHVIRIRSRPSYPYNGNPYIGTKASSYWDGPRSPFQYRIRCLIVRYFFSLNLKAMRSWFTVFWYLYTGACKSQSNNSNSPNPSSSSYVVSNYKNAQEAMFLHSITKARVQVEIVLQKLIGQCL